MSGWTRCDGPWSTCSHWPLIVTVGLWLVIAHTLHGSTFARHEQLSTDFTVGCHCRFPAYCLPVFLAVCWPMHGKRMRLIILTIGHKQAARWRRTARQTSHAKPFFFPRSGFLVYSFILHETGSSHTPGCHSHVWRFRDAVDARAGHGLLSFAFRKLSNICPYVHLGRANFQRHMEDDRISENPPQRWTFFFGMFDILVIAVEVITGSFCYIPRCR